MPHREPGLCGHAYRWGCVFLAAGIGGGIAIAAIDLTRFESGVNAIPRELHALAIAGSTLTILAGLIAMIGAHIVRGQRKLAAQLGQAGPGYAEGYADGLARRPAASSRRHLTLVDGPDAS